MSLALSLAAVGIASYLTFTHYADPAALACPDSGVVNCTLVTTSSWSVLLGVPLAVLDGSIDLDDGCAERYARSTD